MLSRSFCNHFKVPFLQFFRSFFCNFLPKYSEPIQKISKYVSFSKKLKIIKGFSRALPPARFFIQKPAAEIIGEFFGVSVSASVLTLAAVSASASASGPKPQQNRPQTGLICVRRSPDESSSPGY